MKSKILFVWYDVHMHTIGVLDWFIMETKASAILFSLSRVSNKDCKIFKWRIFIISVYSTLL